MIILYSILKFILRFGFINIIILISLARFFKNIYILRKHSGKKVEEFKYKSLMRGFTIAFLVIINATLIYPATKNPSLYNVISIIALNTFLIIEGIKAYKNIEIYENGFIINGEYRKWEEIKDIHDRFGRLEIKFNNSNIFGFIATEKKRIERAEDLIILLKESYEKSKS